MSRKRGKQRKAPVEAVPEDILAEGSGPLRRIDDAAIDAITTVEDVVTTDDIATTEDVVTADDVVATPERPGTMSKGKGDRGPADKGAKSDKGGRSAKAAEARGAASRRRGTAAAASRSEEAEAAEAAEAVVADANVADADADSVDADSADADAVDADAADAIADADGIEVVAGNGAVDDAGDAGDATAAADDENAGLAAAEVVEEASLEEASLADDGEPGGDDDDGAVVFPTSAASMDAVQIKHLVEALIFASDRPLTVQRLRQLTRVGDVRRLEQAVTEIAEDYRERGLVLQQVSGGYQFRTRTQFSAWVQQLIAGRPVRLSRAQLETLAIIAYRQPITRPEIDDIRGVDSTATLKLLIDRMLVRVLGKREEVGRPMLYGTTKEFLDFFSLGDLRELPTLREYSELTAESRKVMSDRLGIAPDGSDGSDGTGGGGEGGPDDGGDGGPDDDGSGGSGGGGSDDGGGSNGHGGNGHGGGSNGHGGNGLGGGGHADDAHVGAEPSSRDDAHVGAERSGPEGAHVGTEPSSRDDAHVGAERSGPETTHEGAEPSSGHVDVEVSGLSAEDVLAEEEPVESEVPGEVSDAVTAFWAASDAVDRSSAAAVGDDEAPADTWFDPAIGDDDDDDAADGAAAARQDDRLDGAPSAEPVAE